MDLVLPNPEDAWFWHKLRNQASTQKFNPAGEVRLDALASQLATTNRPFSEKLSAHRFYLKESAGRFVAVISIKGIDWNMGTGEIGYLVDEDLQNRGYATEAARLIIRKAFTEGGLRKIRAITFAANIASGRVLEKVGFAKEGFLKDEYWLNGRAEDAILWAIFGYEEV